MVRACIALLVTALVSSDAATLAPRRPAAVSKALALRGGAVSGVSLCAAAPVASSKPKKAAVVLGVNAFVSTAYGILGIAAPNAMLAIFGVTGVLDFMNPAFGVCQYLGAMHLANALRCFGALGMPVVPATDTKETLQGLCAFHTLQGLVAGFRQFKGSSSPVIGSVIMAGLAYWAQQE